jgi:hypothetical protein
MEIKTKIAMTLDKQAKYWTQEEIGQVLYLEFSFMAQITGL